MAIVIRRIVFTITTLLLISMSFSFSNQTGSASGRLSKGIIAQTLQTEYFGDMSYHSKAEAVKDSDLYVRKGAHFTEYALLGASLYFLLSAWILKSRWKPYVFSMLACILYASADELHQMFSSGRTPAAVDVLIDFSGCVFACLIIFAIQCIFQRHKRKN